MFIALVGSHLYLALIKYFFIVSKEYIRIVVFCIHDYTSQVQFHSILMEFFLTSDSTDESGKDETCLQFKMNKHFIKNRKISQKEPFIQSLCCKIGRTITIRCIAIQEAKFSESSSTQFRAPLKPLGPPSRALRIEGLNEGL